MEVSMPHPISHLSKIYPQSRIDSDVGKNSTPEEVSKHITKLWESWESTELHINLSKLHHKHVVRHLTDMGYDLGFNFQFRGNRIRFYDSIIQGMFTLTFGDSIIPRHDVNGFRTLA
jgi:hypothetical protein